MTGRPDTQLAARPCPDDWLLRDDGQIDPEFDTPEDRSHNGRWGDLIAVNADSGEQLTVEAGDRIRLRLVNASNGTVYTQTSANSTPPLSQSTGSPPETLLTARDSSSPRATSAGDARWRRGVDRARVKPTEMHRGDRGSDHALDRCLDRTDFSAWRVVDLRLGGCGTSERQHAGCGRRWGLRVLSVHRLGAGSEGYYLDQVVAGVEDYYAGAGEAPGEWLASSALLGLEGRVDPDDLRAVLLGVDPGSGDGLHHGSGRSVPGWDLTFRAPKSVSVLWGLADPEIADVVVAAHEAAMQVGLRYVEEWAGFTRTGRGGATRVRGDGLIAAGFRHRTSRDGDPHLHTHVLVANSVRTPDGRWRTLDGRGLLVHMKTAGYVYDAQLRHELTARSVSSGARS